MTNADFDQTVLNTYTKGCYGDNFLQDEDSQLPYGPLCYRDTQLIQADRFHYMHYPRLVLIFFFGISIQETVESFKYLSLSSHKLSEK